MANPYVNKVVLADGTVKLNLENDTVDASHLASGYTAHDKSGAIITGTMSGLVVPTVAVLGDVPIYYWAGTYYSSAESYALRDSYTVKIGGNYRVKFSLARLGTCYGQIRIYDPVTDTETTVYSGTKSSDGTTAGFFSFDTDTLTANQVIRLYSYAASQLGNTSHSCVGFAVCMAWDNYPF